MKIAVFSDSHNSSYSMIQAILDENPDCIIHLGDGIKDCDKLSCFSIPIYSVCGNNDFGHLTDIEKLIEIAGKKLFLTHGHHYNVKNTFYSVIEKAKRINCDVLLFGHTHEPYCQKEGKMFIMNPGSIKYNNSYGIITIDKDRLNVYTVKK